MAAISRAASSKVVKEDPALPVPPKSRATDCKVQRVVGGCAVTEGLPIASGSPPEALRGVLTWKPGSEKDPKTQPSIKTIETCDRRLRTLGPAIVACERSLSTQLTCQDHFVYNHGMKVWEWVKPVLMQISDISALGWACPKARIEKKDSKLKGRVEWIEYKLKIETLRAKCEALYREEALLQQSARPGTPADKKELKAKVWHLEEDFLETLFATPSRPVCGRPSIRLSKPPTSLDWKDVAPELADALPLEQRKFLYQQEYRELLARQACAFRSIDRACFKHVWPLDKKVLRVRFLDPKDSTLASKELQSRMQKIFDYATQWTQGTGIKFERVEGAEPADIRIKLDKSNSCWSNVGTSAELVADQTEATMVFGWFLKEKLEEWELKRTALHEFGHALGLHHEHQNPLCPIKIDEKAVRDDALKRQKTWSERDFKCNYLKYSSEQAVGTRFDRRSIMLYPIESEFTRDGISSSWNHELSPGDKAFVKHLYPSA